MSYEDRPLVLALENFHKQQPISFHVPGHKHGILSGLPQAMQQALSYDVTELTGLDDLHQPKEVILQAEKKLSRLYGSGRSFFLVNGSTVGNLAMLYATVGKDDMVLVQRNAHKSVFHALELTGAQAIFLSPQWNEHTKTVGGVARASVKEALMRYPNVKAAVFTYPTYYGVANAELEDIISICHEQGIPVLVDEAHGAHFVVNESFPDSALSLGADVVVQSAHKTLPAMTMASFLHVRSKLVKMERVAHYLHMLQSSSPSYLLMASLDDARQYAESYNEADFAYFLSYRQQLLKELRSIPDMDVLEVDDALKLLIRVEGHTGFALQEVLEQQGIYSELADLFQVLFVLPLVKVGHMGMPADLIKKFRSAVDALHIADRTALPQVLSLPTMPMSSSAYTVDQLREMKAEWLGIEDAEGRVALEAVVPYPPGIPLLCPGERVTEEQVRQLIDLIEAGSRFQGALDIKTNRIKVVIE
ncbi:aminotransferase class I/II-fold pyridoxal phosphate-dependent enzyme [Sporosarcina obsidiansis]|uniref:aminotransferase class I/II-fold pyridoxal phosphate-dependent enzyme n=1 Tax=Sporosarcina obsidiansis TaxID=2660748 RepID=UPI00129BDAF7|nr:aminotransferase class I/II-fold pyridoxal phosphate-dependent enzyme [Sporosarcina obsidiansis]